uniref:Uncharacterized protein n=1 Tax=Sphaerodactylus townsendi TaxID=933632 RepID=A0ACB8G959_9SAUR
MHCLSSVPFRFLLFPSPTTLHSSTQRTNLSLRSSFDKIFKCQEKKKTLVGEELHKHTQFTCFGAEEYIFPSKLEEDAIVAKHCLSFSAHINIAEVEPENGFQAIWRPGIVWSG